MFSPSAVFLTIDLNRNCFNRINIHLGYVDSIHVLADLYQISCVQIVYFYISELNHTFADSNRYVVFGLNFALATNFYI